MFTRASHRDCKRLDLDGLGHEVVRARADCTDGGLEAAECGQHDHGNIGTVGDHALTQLEPGHRLHVEVGDDDVDIVNGERGECVRTGAERQYGQASLLEAELHKVHHL